jgi:hypothetical protein
MPQYFSQAPNAELTYEHCQSFGGGMDGYTRSTLLAPDQYQYGENVFVSENLEGRTRAGADKFVNNVFAAKIQGLFYFDTPTLEQLIFASGGVMYKAASDGSYAAINGFTLNDGDVDFVAAQGVDKAAVVDGVKFGLWDGANWTSYTSATRGPTDPPTGATTVIFHAGRMFAAGFPGTDGAGRESDAVCCSALLSYGTADWDLVDRSFRVGAGEGDPVLGLAKIPASVPEQAVLAALKQNSIHLIRTDPTQSPAHWQDTIAPEPVANGLGVVGKRAFCVLGNDLYYVAPDRTIRSLQRMQSAAAQYEVTPALSIPLQPYMDRINWAQQARIAVTRYKQLAIFSVPLDNSQTPNTVFVWNGRLGKWVGVWTGWTANSWEITRFNGVLRLLHGDNGGRVRMWKDTNDATADATYQDDGTDYGTKLWGRAHLFNEPLNDKQLRHNEIRFGQSNAVVKVTLNADNADVKKWSCDVRPVGPDLPIDLPFDLSNPVNTPFRKGLLSTPPFSECFIKIESDRGWFSVKSFSFSAFLNTISTQ